MNALQLEGLARHYGEREALADVSLSLPEEAWAVRGRIGLLAHEPLLYRELTARENLRLHARLHGVELSRVDELLQLVHMDGRSQEPLRTLSRGMVQRVAVARAVLHDPQLLLLDEPHAHLDPAAVETLDALIGAPCGRGMGRLRRRGPGPRLRRARVRGPGDV